MRRLGITKATTLPANSAYLEEIDPSPVNPSLYQTVFGKGPKSSRRG